MAAYQLIWRPDSPDISHNNRLVRSRSFDRRLFLLDKMILLFYLAKVCCGIKFFKIVFVVFMHFLL